MGSIVYYMKNGALSILPDTRTPPGGYFHLLRSLWTVRPWTEIEKITTK